jgi:hypothetical protein
MSDKNATYNINAFPGNETHGLMWAVQKRHLIDVARSAYVNPQDGLGLIYYLTNEAKYAELFYMYHGRLPDKEDGDKTSSSSSSLATAPKNEYYVVPKMPIKTSFKMNENSGRDYYKMEYAAWEAETHAVQTFRTKLLESLDKIALSVVGTSDERMRMTIRDIYESLDVRFSKVSSAELKKESSKIRKPLLAIDMFDEVIEHHTATHQFCQDNNMTISENQKIFDFQSALENFPTFDLADTLFDRDHDVKDKDRTFKKLAAECLQHWNRAGKDEKFEKSNTTLAHGYANNINFKRKAEDSETDDQPGPSVEERLGKMEKSLAASVKQAQAQKGGKKPKVHCKVHGWCTHTTEQCRDTEEQPKDRTHRFPKEAKSHKGK